MKNNFITKIIGATLAFAMMIGGAVGINAAKEAKEVNAATETVEITPANLAGWNSTQGAQTGSYGGITITSDNAANSTQLRLYSGGTHTFTSSVGNITKAVFTCTTNGTSNYGPGKMSGSGYTASSGKTGTWEGDAASFTLSGGQSRVTSIVFTYTVASVTEATGLTITPSTPTTIFAGESVTFNTALTGGSGAYEKTISWTSDHPSIIAAPADSEEGNSVTVTAASAVASQTTVRLTGTVANPGSATNYIDIVVKPARTMQSIELHGTIAKTEYYVGDNWELDGLNIQVNWSDGDPTFVDLDDNAVVYELTPANALNTSVNSFDIEVIYDNFDETFTVDGLTVTEHPLVDILDETTIPSSAIGTATSSWGNWTEVTDYTYSASNTNGAKYQVKLMGPGSGSYVGRMNNSTNGGFYTSKAPIGVRIKTIGFSAIAASKNVSVYLSNEIYESLPATTDYKATLTSTNLSYTVEGNFSCFAIRGRDSSLDVGALTIEYEEINPSISASPDSITLSVNNSQNVEITVENYTSIPTLECNIQSGAASISSATVGNVNSTTYKATATITASNVSGNAVVRVRDTANPNLYYIDIDVTVESVANVIENTITTSSSLAYHYSMNGAVVDRLDKDFTGNEEKTYANWSEKVGTSGAVYAGNTYGGAENIQLKSNDSVSGIVTTSSAGFAKKITVVWNDGTQNGRTLDVYGKNTAYEAATDLYDNSTKGTKIGSIVKGTSTSLTITDDYEFVGLRSSSGGMNIESIDIQWGDYSYTYSNISMRFGGSIDKDLWDELDTNENPIAGVGVLITGYEEQQRSPYSIKDHYDEAVQFNAVTNIKTQVGNCYVSLNDFNIPEKNNAYYWNLKYAIASIDDMLDSYTAAAYIKLTNGDLVFLKQVKYSVWSLAKDYLDNRGSNEETADGSLYNIVASAGLE